MPGDPDALWDRRMGSEQPDRSGCIGEALGHVARNAGVELEGGDARCGERIAEVPPGLAAAGAGRQHRDPADRLAVREVEDAFDLDARDRERDPLEH
jgi:hypothetical protein